jgi:hypothetical protein
MLQETDPGREPSENDDECNRQESVKDRFNHGIDLFSLEASSK